MAKNICRAILVMGSVLGVAVALSFLRPSSDESQALVVFSNYPTSDLGIMSTGLTMAYIVDVPAGQEDYQLNTIRLRTANIPVGVTINVSVFQDGGAAPGALVADFGTQPGTPNARADLIFNAPANTVLQNGQRYWVRYQPSGWMQLDFRGAGQSPSGIFTFVDFRMSIAGNWQTQTSRITTSIDADPINIPPPSTGNNNTPTCSNNDGRLNSICEEPWQTAAIYCRADGTIDVYGITDSEGWLAFRTTQSVIDAVGVPTQNSLIERSSDGKIRLYRLATGEFQVNAPRWDQMRGNLPDGYVFRFNGCP